MPLRSVTIRLEGPAVREGRVSIRTLARTLGAIQQAILDLGESRLTRAPSAPSRKPELLARECELFLSEVSKGSFQATLELPAVKESLFPEFRDFAESVLTDFKTVAEGIEKGDSEQVLRVVPDASHRTRLIKDMMPIIPSADAEYGVSVRFGNLKKRIRLARPTEQWMSRVGGGALGKVSVGEPDEAVVHARCSVRAKPGGELEIVKTLDVIEYSLFEESDLAAYQPTRVEHGEEVFVLKDVLPCAVAREEGLVVVTYEPLHIMAFAVSREEAIRNFAEEFSFLWNEYASRDDSELTEDAKDLKRLLFSLVKEKKP